ncbi:branched-chain amino acid transport system II carrier protein [Atopobium fossor]|uniref:branched-chain amino acid transport system II carrier protein n=1 Tax=Atopobium fossor TaxID=39487 RepID=UPI0003FF175F|nr:branched-chain amino acid transport system II carrier protein [Atopobium fossor]
MQEQTAMRLSTKNSIVVGITLFSMLFGAGNLILAPMVGAQAGTAAIPALAGFIVSAVGLPILTIAAVAKIGSAAQLGNLIHPVFSKVFMALVYLSIGPFLAIPRTASTSFRMLLPLLDLSQDGVALAQVLFTLAFFAAAFALAMRPTMLNKLMGTFSGPALIVLITLLVGKTLMFPPATPELTQVAAYASNPAATGFIRGYETMDMLGTLAFGVVVALNIKSLGLEDPNAISGQVIYSGIVAGIIMAAVYIGMGFIGLTTGPLVGATVNGADIISSAANMQYGVAGSVLVAAIFLIACLNVCVGLVSSISEYFVTTEVGEHLSYKQLTIITVLVSAAFANFGLDAILAYSVPVLSALYPVTIILMIMGLAGGIKPATALAWRLTVAVCIIISASVAIRNGFAPKTWIVFDVLPLAKLSLAWLIPSVVTFLLGWMYSVAAGKKH